MKTSKEENMHFKAFEILPSNVKLAWDKLRAECKLDEFEKKAKMKIKMPKIEAFGVADEDFDKMLNERRQKIPTLYLTGEKYPTNKMYSWTTICKHKTTNEIHHTEIFIRASLYTKNKQKFYEALERELMNVLSVGGIAVIASPAKTKKSKRSR